MNDNGFRNAFLVVLVLAISAIFIAMIRSFLMTILLAAIFSGLMHPLYDRLRRRFRDRRALASAVTLVIVVLLVVGPLLGFLGVVATQAIKVSNAVGPWIQEQVSKPDALAGLLERLPFADKLAPYREEILTRAGQLVGTVGNFVVSSLSAATRGTVNFLFHAFILLYTMFFFLMDGGRILDRILYYLPLPPEDESRMVEKFVSVSRATLKGTVIIGVIQGALAGVALAVAGVQGAVFWGTIMTVLSIIPGVGTALVWAPAAIYLMATGRVVAGVALFVFCGAIVGSVDNFLRPRLVGKDTQMHDLLILFSTLGGLLLFGVVGFIIGPILAALFVTVWDIYGVAFRDILPATARHGAGSDDDAV
jgi:predicted PurR-regulated permease PerM